MFSGQNTTVRIQKKVFGKDIYVVILAFLLYWGGGLYFFQRLSAMLSFTFEIESTYTQRIINKLFHH